MKKLKYIIIGIFVIGIIILCIYNIGENSDFFKINIGNIITIIIAVVISYFFVQNKTDDRKKRDIIDDNIRQIKSLLSEDCYNIKSDDDSRIIQSKLRTIANYLHLFKGLKGNFIANQDIDYIDEHFETYNIIISEHKDDPVHLSNSRAELHREINLIDNRLSEVRVKLYNLK